MRYIDLQCKDTKRLKNGNDNDKRRTKTNKIHPKARRNAPFDCKAAANAALCAKQSNH